MQAPRSSRPSVGITPDIEWRDEPSPARAHYVLDTQLVEALAQPSAAPLMLSHDVSAIDELLAHIDGRVLSGGDWLVPHRLLVSGDATEPPHKARRARFEMALARAALPRDLPLLGVCDGFQVLDGSPEANSSPDRRFVMGTQWHPEFLLNETDRRLLRAFVDASMAASAPPP